MQYKLTAYENYQHINLNVLKTYSLFSDVTLGLSDHTPSHSTVLVQLPLVHYNREALHFG